jgi:hypothetical protein
VQQKAQQKTCCAGLTNTKKQYTIDIETVAHRIDGLPLGWKLSNRQVCEARAVTSFYYSKWSERFESR